MGWIIGMILAIVICGIVFFIGRAIQRSAKGNPDGDDFLVGTWIKRGALIVFVLWVGIWTILASFHQVPAGSVGVVYQFGSIVGQRSEGLQLTTPWQSVHEESTQVQRQSFDQITAFSSENQDVFIKATINYSVSPGAVQQLLRNVGFDWFNRLIETRINNFLKEETVKYSTVNITPERETIRLAVRDRLAKDLAQYSINVDDFLIDDIDFDQSFKDAINKKQVALQQIETEKNNVQIADQQAQQKAKLAQGDANALRITAQGQADANRLLSESLTPELIQFQALQKLADNIQIALIPSGQGLIIDPASLLGLITPTPAATPTATPSPTPVATETPTETPTE